MGASFHRTMIECERIFCGDGNTVVYSSKRKFCGFHKLWNFLSNSVRMRKDSGSPLVSANRLSRSFKSLCLRSK